MTVPGAALFARTAGIKGVTNGRRPYFGLSSTNRTYIVTLVFGVLLIFGPVEPYGFAIRSLYLVLIPAGVWFILRHLDARLDIDSRTNDRIWRALTASIAGMLVVASYQSFTAKQHLQCTQSVRDGQGGRECVGDFVTVRGPDKGQAFMWILLAGVAFWVAIAPQQE